MVDKIDGVQDALKHFVDSCFHHLATATSRHAHRQDAKNAKNFAKQFFPGEQEFSL